MVGGKPTQDNSLRNYRHQLSWLCLERRNLLTTLLKAGRDKNNKMKTRLALDKNEKTFELLGEYIIAKTICTNFQNEMCIFLHFFAVRIPAWNII